MEKEEGKVVDLLVVRLICRKHGHEVIKTSLYTWYRAVNSKIACNPKPWIRAI
jgi:hypothetical protein